MWTRKYFIVAIALIGTGCTHEQLRYNTIRQAETVSDVHQQQVLNNLAKFVESPNALPDFAWPKSGLTDVTDTGSASAGLNWSRVMSGAFLFSAVSLNGNAMRTEKENWSLTPINDPRKLELMRCAYQKAVASCGIGGVAGDCPNCRKRWNKFYTGKAYALNDDRTVKTDENDPTRVRNELEASSAGNKGSGVVTSECLYPGCCTWFGYGTKKEVPKDCPPNCIGRYSDTYVWVMPDGRDELTKLTLAILDYAVNNPPAPRMKEVVVYLDQSGNPAKRKDAVQKVTSTIPISAENRHVKAFADLTKTDKKIKALRKEIKDLKARNDDSREKERELRVLEEAAERIQSLPPTRTRPPSAPAQDLQQLLDAIQ